MGMKHGALSPLRCKQRVVSHFHLAALSMPIFRVESDYGNYDGNISNVIRPALSCCTRVAPDCSLAAA